MFKTRGGFTMKAAYRTLACIGLVFAMAVVVRAADEKKTLKGEIGCAKCVFKVEGVKTCTNAIKVKDGDKEVIYIIDDGGRKAKYHGKICTDGKKGSVTGVVSKKGEKLYIKPEKGGVKFED
jgi:hypothetical protein